MNKIKITRLKTPITYYGGKQLMLKNIRPLIPAHTLYCEPFCGGAAVFFDKEPAEIEVINDLNGELINFYRTVVSNFDELKKEIEKTLHCRGQHKHAWYIYNNPEYFSSIERAWAVFILSKLGFAGQLSSSFGFDKGKARHPLKIVNAKEQFNEQLKLRLEHTTIEQDDAFKIIERYDIEHAWMFIDPPYIGSDMGHYSDMFNEQNLADLLQILTGVKCKFMLTMYPNELIEEYAINNDWAIHKIERQVTACKASSRRKQEEWMITNY